MESDQSHHKTEHNNSKSDNRDSDNKGGGKKPELQSRRQSTLTRQSGFFNDSDSRQSVEAPSFDLRTEDGNVLVVVSNLDDDGDEKEQIIDVEDGDIEIDCEDNFEYSSMRLQEGRGSASSVHSAPDNADNCSVSVELDVSSLGSDNEEELCNEDFIEHADEDKKQKLRKEETIESQPEVIATQRTIRFKFVFTIIGCVILNMLDLCLKVQLMQAFAEHSSCALVWDEKQSSLKV